MRKKSQSGDAESLSRRERQVFDALMKLGAATAEQIRSHLPDPPSNSSVRTVLTRLEGYGLVVHEAQDLRYVYRPSRSRRQARRSAVRRLVDVFFDGSATEAVIGLLDHSSPELTQDDIDQLREILDRARRQRRTK